MSFKIATTKKFHWVDIDDVKNKDIEYLRNKYNFHHLDLEDCLSISQRPKLDIYENYLFMVLHIPNYNEQAQRIVSRELHIFAGQDFIVTVKKKKIEALAHYFIDFSNGLVKLNKNKENPFYFLYNILENLYNNSLPAIDIISRNLNRVETEIFDERSKGAARDIAIVRRNILNFRKILEPEIKIFDKLTTLKKKYIPHGISVYFDDIQDYLERTWSTLDNYKDIIDGLGQTYESLISKRTNEVMKVLTVISVGLLPLTLVASIYGMNISGLPFAEHPIVIWIFFIVLMFFISLLVFISHRRNVL